MIPSSLPDELPITVLSPGAELWRIHGRAHDPLHFGTGGLNRFDAPEGVFGVCYLGDSLEVSFLEVFVRGSRHRMVHRNDLRTRSASAFRVLKACRLLRLHSEGLVALGLPADMPHSEPYTACQALALAVHRHAAGVDGIEYRSRWDDRRLCVAIFDRTEARIDPAPIRTVRLDDLAALQPILHAYDIRVII